MLWSLDWEAEAYRAEFGGSKSAAEAKVFAAEPETAAPLADLSQGSAEYFPNWKASFVDGCGGKSVSRACGTSRTIFLRIDRGDARRGTARDEDRRGTKTTSSPKERGRAPSRRA